MVKHIIWGTGFCLSTTYAGSRGMGYYMAGMVKVFAREGSSNNRGMLSKDKD